ncbi:LbtU family siderophore porin [Candidatus Poribacteria bacterium]
MKARPILTGFTILLLSMLANAAYAVEPNKAAGVWLLNEGEGDVAKDSSDNDHHGQIFADVKWTEGTSGSALEFPGHGEAGYVRIPHEATLDLVEYSITAWLKLTSTEVVPTENAWQLLLGKWKPHGVRNYGIMARKDTGVILAQFTSGGEKQYKTIVGTTDLANEEWHHIACTYDGSFLRLYVDGAMEAEMESPEPDINLGDITIGAALGGAYPTRGAIDDVGLFNVALNESEIEEIMTHGLWSALGLEEVAEVSQAIEKAVEKAVKIAVAETIEEAVEKSVSTALSPEHLSAAGEEGAFGGIEFSGALESEFCHVAGNGDSGNDFVLSTVELGAAVPLGQSVSGSVVFLYEQGENDDNIAVDEGLINLSVPVVPATDLALSLGLMCVPFGEFSSHFLADPYTVDIGETSQLALQLSASHKMLNASAAIYNEEVEIEGSSNARIGDMAFRVAASMPEGVLGDGGSLMVGTSFITNMAGTDGLGDNGSVLARAKGLGSFISFSVMGAFLEGEFIQALDDMQPSNGDSASKPHAFNMELGYSFSNIPVEVAGRYERLSENEDDSTNRFGGVVSLGLFRETTSLALEFLHTESGHGDENSIVSQLALEF